MSEASTVRIGDCIKCQLKTQPREVKIDIVDEESLAYAKELLSQTSPKWRLVQVGYSDDYIRDLITDMQAALIDYGVMDKGPDKLNSRAQNVMRRRIREGDVTRVGSFLSRRDLKG